MKIGFIGLGLMGRPMSTNIIKKHPDKVYLSNRTHEKAVRLAEELAEYGPEAIEDKRELAGLSDVVITMVTNTQDVEQIAEEILPEFGPGKIWIDMSTISPTASSALADKVKARGGQFADAPVVKSVAAAEAGKLGVYAGCDEEIWDDIRPILAYMGGNIIRLGGNGCGLVMKLCHNALVSQIQNGVNETLALASKYGIDARTYAKSISYGGGQNLYLDNHVEMLAEENYKAAFSLQNASKDVHLCLDLAEHIGFPMPGEENVARVYEDALERGLGPMDWGATAEVVKNPKA